jgi:hypothetical protein
VKLELKGKLKAKVDLAKAPAAEVGPTVDLQVRTGVKPFTWFATDGLGEYLVSEADGVYTCNCKPKCTDCAHAAAVKGFAAQS